MKVNFNQLDCFYHGSVKNLYQNDKNIFFEFTDKYSIFDWGEMPDLIPNKGKSLNTMACSFFKILMNPSFWSKLDLPKELHDLKTQYSKYGMPTHFIKEYENAIEVKKVNVFRPVYAKEDAIYSEYQQSPKNALVPLEVIFRFSITSGSSILERAKDQNYMDSLNLTSIKEKDQFLLPIIEFSTKLERSDRYLGYSEAKKIAGLSDSEFNILIKTAQANAFALKKVFDQLDINLIDGKFEFAFDTNRNFMMVDSIGPDELRLESEGIKLSKEYLRQIYRDSSWYKDLKRAKACSKDFRNYCLNQLNSTPHNLPTNEIKFFSNMYQSIANQIKQISKGKEINKNFLKNTIRRQQ